MGQATAEFNRVADAEPARLAPERAAQGSIPNAPQLRVAEAGPHPLKGAQPIDLLNHPEHRIAMGTSAADIARHRSAPERCIARYYEAFAEARQHLRESVAKGDASQMRSRLAHWAVMHALLIALSYVRRRALVNRNRSAHPGWGESLDFATARS
jgi:hypothetical protein